MFERRYPAWMHKTICSSHRLSSENIHMPFYELLVREAHTVETTIDFSSRT